MLTANTSHLQSDYDVLVIGGGPAGMGAAIAARVAGADRVLIVDREVEPGGILLQCIHPGFGLQHFKEELTGPEYAQRVYEQVVETEIDVITDSYVIDIARSTGFTSFAPNSSTPASRSPEKLCVKLLSAQHGVKLITTTATVLAMGARERTRGAIRTPGTRPAGVMTAGLAQRFVNLMGILPGKRAVILGSGDIGLIMARRLTLEGVEVAGVFEIMPHANGLNRNLVQCLQDYDIPLHLSTTVAEIHGHDRVEKVTVAPVDGFTPDPSRGWDIECDTLLLSIGLIPDNELSRTLGLRIDPVTSGPIVDSQMETSMAGVFACGNVVHIHDLVDFVSQEAMLAGHSAGQYAIGQTRPADNIRLVPGDNVAYCVPQSIASDREHTVYLRVRQPLENCRLRLSGGAAGVVYEKKIRFVLPAEMVNLKLKPRFLQDFHGDTLKVEVLPDN